MRRFLDDYQAIPGKEAWRPELALVDFLHLDRDTRRPRGRTLRPRRIRRLRVAEASPAEGNGSGSA